MVIVAIVSLSYVSTASAELLDWRYTYGDANVISGVFTGTDAGNYFTVTVLQSFSVNGVATNYLAGAAPESDDAFVGKGAGHNGNGSAVVTLDGSYMDFIDTPDGGSTGLSFIVGDAQAQDANNTGTLVFLPPILDDSDIPFVQASWSATLVDVDTAVPEPPAVAVF